MREFGYYILFGACRNELNHCETTKDILSAAQLTVKQYDFASSCNYINKFGGRLGSFKDGIERIQNCCHQLLSAQDQIKGAATGREMTPTA